jgi:hypothetical protein
VPHLLGDVHRIVEADQGVEREGRAGQYHQWDAAGTLPELEGSTRVPRAPGECGYPDQDDEQEPEDLDRREGRVELDRLRDAPEVDQGENEYEYECGEDLRYLNELRQVVPAEREREGGGRGEPGTHDGEGDHEA